MSHHSLCRLPTAPHLGSQASLVHRRPPMPVILGYPVPPVRPMIGQLGLFCLSILHKLSEVVVEGAEIFSPFKQSIVCHMCVNPTLKTASSRAYFVPFI